MRRRVDLRWRIQPEEIERLRAAQLDLLKQAATKVKPGGVLVYSTCSLEPEENGEVVKQFLSDHADFKLESERELLPFVDGVDGAYVARMKCSSRVGQASRLFQVPIREFSYRLSGCFPSSIVSGGRRKRQARGLSTHYIPMIW